MLEFNSNLALEYSRQLSESTDNDFRKLIITTFVKELRILAIQNDDKLPNPTVINYFLPKNFEVILQDFLTHMNCKPAYIQFLGFKVVIWF